MDFQSFNLSQEVKKAVVDAGYTAPTEIQEKSIPLILEGCDIIGFSETGSGKTAAFGLPAIDIVDREMNARKTQVLILCPTRELAMQARDELFKFSKYKEGLHVVPVYGGQNIVIQLNQLSKGCQIVVGTPGRIMDHMRRHTIKLDNLKMVVLDEADEMLNMGFREDIETILSEAPDERQTVLFSATMPQAILDITKEYQKEPKLVKIESPQMTVATTEQFYYDVPRGRKMDALSLLLQYYQPKRTIVFCNTKKMVDEVVEDLESRGCSAQKLHGDIKQQQRTQVMNSFKSGNFEILVATDVAARGIDVNDVDIVFNFDIPQDPEYYVHRIGRTGRAGKEGKSFTLIQGRGQYSEMMGIAKFTKSKIERRELPRIADIVKKNSSAVFDEVRAVIKSRDTDSMKEELNTLLSEGFTAEQVACSMLELYMKNKVINEKTVDVQRVDSATEPRNERRSQKPRVERKPNPKADSKFEGVDMVKVTISIGRKDRVAPKHILGAVAGESGLPGNIMGSIDIGSNYTTIEVPKEFKSRIVKAIDNKKINNTRVSAK